MIRPYRAAHFHVEVPLEVAAKLRPPPDYSTSILVDRSFWSTRNYNIRSRLSIYFRHLDLSPDSSGHSCTTPPLTTLRLTAALTARCTGHLRTTPKGGLNHSSAEMVYGQPITVPGEFFPTTDDVTTEQLRTTVRKFEPCRPSKTNSRPHYTPSDLLRSRGRPPPTSFPPI